MELGIDTESFHLAFQNKQMNIFSFIDEAVRLGYQGVMINLVEKKNLTQGLGALGSFDEAHIKKVGAYLKERDLFVELADRGTSLHPLHTYKRPYCMQTKWDIFYMRSPDWSRKY